MTIDKKEQVRAVFDAYQTKDRARLEALFADEFTFTSPYDDAIDRQAYFEHCWPGGERIERHFLEELVENQGRVFVLYKCRLKDGREFRNVETFDFANGRISAVNVYFGAAYRGGAFVKS